jgi:anti-anti-sigma regulatory factor
VPEADEATAARASAQRAFSISSDRDEEVYLLKAEGELDRVTGEALSDELKRAEASEAEGILLDLSGVASPSSSTPIGA